MGLGGGVLGLVVIVWYRAFLFLDITWCFGCLVFVVLFRLCGFGLNLLCWFVALGGLGFGFVCYGCFGFVGLVGCVCCFWVLLEW